MFSDSGMKTHDEVEGILDRNNEILPVVNVNVELSLQGIMNKYASLNVDIRIFTVPVGCECYWHSVPSLGVHVSQSISNALYDSLSENVRLLVKMMMVGVWIVKASHLHLGEKGSISQENLASGLEE